MHRFHLPPDQCQGEELTLTAGEAHHALHVLRMRPGDPLIVLDGAGGQYEGQIGSLDRHGLRFIVSRRRKFPAWPCELTLVQSVPKGKTFESLIQKATELGVRRIVPLLSARVVMKLDRDQAQSKIEHWRSTAIEAIKQCGSPWLPHMDPPVTPAQFLSRRESFDLSLVASLQPGSQHPRHWLDAHRVQHGFKPRSVAVWIGPEGDFTPEEIRAIEAAGAAPISLGPLTLRVETAALYCLSVLNYELQAPDAPGPVDRLNEFTGHREPHPVPEQTPGTPGPDAPGG